MAVEEEMELPSPSRRILIELNPLFYPFGNTPARNLLEGHQVDHPYKVLLLGCGDIRNVLWTAGQCTAAHPLTFHLNDLSPAVCARNVLLLHIVQHMDPEKSADVQYLWDVWYNGFWGEATQERFRKDVQRVLNALETHRRERQGSPEAAANGSNTLTPPDLRDPERTASQAATKPDKLSPARTSQQPEDIAMPEHWRAGDEAMSAQLEHTLRWWLDVGMNRSMANVQSERLDFIRRFLQTRAQMNKDNSPFDLDNQIAIYSRLYTYSMLEEGPSIYGQENAGLIEAFQEEIKCYYKTGVVPRGTTTDAALSSSFAGVNPTMLQPESGAWHVHYDALPYSAYAPLPIAPLKVLAKRGSGPQGLLGRACMTKLRRGVAAYQARVKSGTVQVTLWDGDALQLCTTRLAAQAFDHIDTSNLADHVGLLNLMACAGPRLVSSPLSRLNTEIILWQTVAEDLPSYLKIAIGPIHPALFPTLFGLRLLTDFELGRPRQGSIVDRMMRQSSDARVLEWAPVFQDAGGAIRPSLAEGVPPQRGAREGGGHDDLGGALQALAARCMVPSYTTGIYRTDRCGLGNATTMTLAFLLAGCVGTPCGSSGYGVLSDPPAPVHIPASFRLGWQAIMGCVAAGEPSRAAGVGAPGAESLPPMPSRPASAPGVADVDAPGAESLPHMTSGLGHAPGTAAADAPGVAARREPPVLMSARMATHQRAAFMNMGYGMGLISRQPSLRMVLGGSEAIHKIAGSFFDAASPDNLAVLAESAGLHFIDNVICAMREGGPDVKFLLPAKDALPLADTYAVLVDVNTFAITEPLSLYRFTRRTVPRSWCRRLFTAQCGHAQRVTLNPPTTSASPPGTSTAHPGLTPSPPGDHAAPCAPPHVAPGGDAAPQGGEAERGRPNRPQKSARPTMTVISCVEAATHYTVELAIDADGDVSGLSITPEYKPGGLATHCVTLALASPAGCSHDIKTLCPVDVRRARLKLFRKQRLISAELPKADFWPVDALLPGMVPKLCADDLQAGWGDKELELALMLMHTEAEITRARKGFESSGIGTTVVNEVKEDIKILFWTAAKDGHVVHQVVVQKNPDHIELFVRIHLPIRKAPDGRPLVPITVVDHRIAEELLKAGQLDAHKEAKQLERVILSATDVRRTLVVEDEAELTMLKRILRKFELRTRPTAWQAANIPRTGPTSHWIAANLMPIYPDKPTSAADDPLANFRNAIKEASTGGQARAGTSFPIASTSGGGKSKGGGTSTRTGVRPDLGAKVQPPHQPPQQPAGLPGLPLRPAATTSQHERGVRGSAGAAGSTAEMRICAACGKSPPVLLKCGHCKRVWYCDRECQKGHWKLHKATCGQS